MTPLAYYHCLDDEFDAFDSEADYELCCALVAGRAGLHPDAWGSHDPLSTLPPLHRSYNLPPAYDELLPVDPVWKAMFRPVVIPVLLGPDPPGAWASPYS